MMPAFHQNEFRDRIRVALLLLLLMTLGFWLRARHLGDLGLIVDEGFQANAVQGILKDGVPKVDSGLIYSRAIPFLYIQAASAQLFGLNEFSLRLPAVLFGVAAIFAAYVLGKTLFNRSVGLLTAAVLTFSVWEIELSRYARFYTAFQCMYLVSLCCFYRGFMIGERFYKFLFIVAALVTISLHPLGIALFTCFLIPLPSTSFSRRDKLVYGVWATGLAGLWVLYDKLVELLNAMGYPYSHIKDEGALVGAFRKIQSIVGEPIGITLFYVPRPRFVIELAREDPLWFLGLALVSGVATAYLLYRFLRRDDGWRALVAIPVVWTAFLHQFGLVLLMLAVYVVFFVRDFRSLLEPPLKVIYGAVAVCLVFWIPVLAATLTVRQVIVVTFGYPLYRFYEYFLFWFLEGWPVLIILFGLGCLLLLARFFSDRSIPAPLFVLGAIYIPAVVTSFARPHYIEARYTFHLYPLMIIVFAMIAMEAGSRVLKIPVRGKWSRGVIAAAITLATLFISQDANPVNAWSVANRTYQNTRDPIKSVINWKFYAGFHQDHKSPSLYVRERLAPGDRVVALGVAHMVAIYHFYVGQVHYAVGNAFRHHRVLKEGKIVAYMTGSEILENLPRLKEIIEGGTGEGIWLLGDRMLLVDDNSVYSKSMKEYLKSLAIAPDYLAMDDQTFAVKLR
jgi:4-amino-4-deoxy-L-arabinose transferase-like glycosyltransferase